MIKTDELIARLSSERRGRALAPTPTMILSTASALVVALTLSVSWLKPRADLTPELLAQNGIFWLKLVFAICVVLVALPIVRDLSIPGRRIGPWSALLSVPFVIILILAVGELAGLPVGKWSHHFEDASWFECLWQIPALAFPAFVILAAAARYLAPVNLMLTGACIGLAAGGMGAIAYSFHCHDDSIAFVAMSYTVAIAETTFIGALLGPWMLGWSSNRGRLQ